MALGAAFGAALRAGTAAFRTEAAFRAVVFRVFALRTDRRPADCGRFLTGADFRAVLRVEVVRAFTARRNFAMPGG